MEINKFFKICYYKISKKIIINIKAMAGLKIGKPDLGYTGSMAESEAFGEVRGYMEHHEWLEWKRENHYMAYRESMDLVRKAQLGDPTEPNPRFASDMQATLVEKLCPGEYDKVRFYTAVGSNLDYQHGVDAFFEVKINDKQIIIVTMDVKIYNPDSVKADILIVFPPEGLDPKDDHDEYYALLENSVMDIIDMINSRRKNSSN